MRRPLGRRHQVAAPREKGSFESVAPRGRRPWGGGLGSHTLSRDGRIRKAHNPWGASGSACKPGMSSCGAGVVGRQGGDARRLSEGGLPGGQPGKGIRVSQSEARAWLERPGSRTAAFRTDEDHTPALPSATGWGEARVPSRVARIVFRGSCSLFRMLGSRRRPSFSAFPVPSAWHILRDGRWSFLERVLIAIAPGTTSCKLRCQSRFQSPAIKCCPRTWTRRVLHKVPGREEVPRMPPDRTSQPRVTKSPRGSRVPHDPTRPATPGIRTVPGSP
jgi:hypothetical protein